MENKLKLSPPWNTFVNELKLLFAEDPEVGVGYTDGSNVVSLYVEDEAKADALTQILPKQKTFGNVTLSIKVIPANKPFAADSTLFEKAFKDNPIVTGFIDIPVQGCTMSFMEFRRQVVQFYNDEMSDPHGNKSTLYEDIARDVFGTHNVFFCTNNKD